MLNKQEILATNLAARDDEILGYQINIDNYELAVKHIDELGDPDLQDFRQQLCDLLVSERREQKKAKVIRHVIAMQLGVPI